MKPFIFKYSLLYFFTVLLFTSFTACKKDNEDGEYRNGEEVELFVDHYQTRVNQMLFTLPNKKPVHYYIEGFTERKLGYTYKVKAEFYITKEPMQDASDRWFKFKKVIREEIYTGTEPFQLPLIANVLVGGTYLELAKTNGNYFYMNYNMKPVNDDVKNKMEEALALKTRIATDYAYARQVSIMATVTHDPENRTKGYLVQSIEIKIVFN